jgi:hypothetical protein
MYINPKDNHAAPWVQQWYCGTWTASTWSRLRTLLMNLDMAESADYFRVHFAVELRHLTPGYCAVEHWSTIIRHSLAHGQAENVIAPIVY